ncbi:AIPR family protein [Ohtaekwangia kribbensis]|uniref:AIPR family protein n=1 Tax=Ohtaekwangia kribbensis TaxID=688913 RepID=A0ABW3K2N3_9BACT
MTNERPYEMSHIAPALKAEFLAHVPAAPSGTSEEKERNFLTRALAAYSLLKLTGCTTAEAANAIVDGGGDGGIDAIYFSPANNTLWLVQSKYIDDGRGQPALGDASKFKNGIEALLQGNFDAFNGNTKWQGLIPQVQGWLKAPALQVKAVMVYTGISVVADDRIRIFEDLRNRFNNEDEFLDFAPYGLTSIHGWITGIDESPGVDRIEIEVLDAGWFRTPYETVLGRVKIDHIVNLYRQHGAKLIAANIRRYKGSTDVNDRILKTAVEEPQSLFYLNNGLTSYCDRLEVHTQDRANPRQKRVTAYGLSVVNGAQTLGTLLKAYPIAGTVVDGYVSIKIISLSGREDDREFARRITESTNYQNQINVRDFAALDEQQERIAAQLQVDGIQYHYKYGDETPDSDESNFNLDDATIALACLESDFQLCARLISDRKSLWSFEEVYPATDLWRTRYEKIFQPSRSSRTIWRAVQAYQIVLERMRAEGRTASGVRKAFFENGRWLILKILFVKMHPERGDELALPSPVKTGVVTKVLEISTALWQAYEEQGFGSGAPHARSVFSSPADCERLYNATMAKLAAGTPQAPAAATGN